MEVERVVDKGLALPVHSPSDAQKRRTILAGKQPKKCYDLGLTVHSILLHSNREYIIIRKHP